VVRVIDLEQVFPGCEASVVMDADADQALGYLAAHGRKEPVGK